MAGFVYIMSNPSFKDGLIKIGKSDRDPSIRCNELYTTGVPESFSLDYYAFVADHHTLESSIHNALASCRYNTSREFFDCSIQSAIDAIRQHAGGGLKFEEVVYIKTRETENLTNKYNEERHEFETTLRAKRRNELIINSLKSLEAEFLQIIAAELNRNRDIIKSRSLYDRFLSRGSKDYASMLESILKKYVWDVVKFFYAKYESNNNEADNLSVDIANHKKALIHLTRVRLAEYYSEFMNDYSDTYWGVVIKGKLSGPAVVRFKSGQLEQGSFVHGTRHGEFIVEHADGRKSILKYDNGSLITSFNIDFDLVFHSDQDNSIYSKVLS